MNKVGVFLMGLKGLRSLEALVQSEYSVEQIEFVICAKDKHVENDYFLEMETLAKAHNLPFHDRNSVAPENFKVDYIIAISWRWLIPKGDFELIVLHDSLLPAYRGFNPLVTALINGDNKIGVTALIGEKDFDSGDIICNRQIEISYPLKIKEAIEMVSLLYKEIVLELLKKIEKKAIERTPQDESFASYSLWRDDEDYHIDWKNSSQSIKRKVDAMGFPYLGCYSFCDKEKIRIVDVEEVTDLNFINRDVGKIWKLQNGHPIVICGEGLLRITKVEDYTSGDSFTFSKLRTRLK